MLPECLPPSEPLHDAAPRDRKRAPEQKGNESPLLRQVLPRDCYHGDEEKKRYDRSGDRRAQVVAIPMPCSESGIHDQGAGVRNKRLVDRERASQDPEEKDHDGGGNVRKDTR